MLAGFFRYSFGTLLVIFILTLNTSLLTTYTLQYDCSWSLKSLESLKACNTITDSMANGYQKAFRLKLQFYTLFLYQSAKTKFSLLWFNCSMLLVWVTAEGTFLQMEQLADTLRGGAGIRNKMYICLYLKRSRLLEVSSHKLTNSSSRVLYDPSLTIYRVSLIRFEQHVALR